MRRASRTVRFALEAARQALEAAGRISNDAQDVASVWGSAYGPCELPVVFVLSLAPPAAFAQALEAVDRNRDGAASTAQGSQFDGPGQTTILLITGSDLVAAWRPFAEWKTSIGK